MVAAAFFNRIFALREDNARKKTCKNPESAQNRPQIMLTKKNDGWQAALCAKPKANASAF
jgi:hypothetical protein